MCGFHPLKGKKAKRAPEMNGNAHRKIWLDRRNVEAPRMGSFSSPGVSWPDSISKNGDGVVRDSTIAED